MNYYTLSPADFTGLLQSVATLNLGYLTVCVTILLAVGGFFYLFNVKPFQESLKQNADELKTLKNEIEARSVALKSEITKLIESQTREFQSSIEKSETEFTRFKEKTVLEVSASIKKSEEATVKNLRDLKEEFHSMVLDIKWREHYWWEGRGVPANALDSLLSYKEMSLEAGILVVSEELWLIRVSEILDKIGVYHDDDPEETKQRLDTLLDKTEGHEMKVDELRKKGLTVFP